MPDDVLDEHLRHCARCSDWQRTAAALHRRVRVSAAPVVPDLTERLLSTLTAPARRPVALDRLLAARIGLGLIALLQLALAGPILVLGHDHTAPVHIAHELGSFDAAVGLGLLVAALRPRLAPGMTPLVGAITVLLLVTATSDLATGRTAVGDETLHLPDLAGFLALGYLTITVRRSRREWRNA